MGHGRTGVWRGGVGRARAPNPRAHSRASPVPGAISQLDPVVHSRLIGRRRGEYAPPPQTTRGSPSCLPPDPHASALAPADYCSPPATARARAGVRHHQPRVVLEHGYVRAREGSSRGALSHALRAGPAPRRQMGRGRAFGARQRSRHHAGRQQNRPVGPKVRIREIALLARRLKTRARRQVSVEEGEAKAQQDGLMFIETSAKAGFNIKARSNPAARARARGVARRAHDGSRAFRRPSSGNWRPRFPAWSRCSSHRNRH